MIPFWVKIAFIFDETVLFVLFCSVDGVKLGQEFMSKHKKTRFVRLYVQKIL